jgi:hypothetical protein
MRPKRISFLQVCTLLGTSVLLASVVVGQKKSDREKENLKGAVRVVRSRSTNYPEGNAVASSPAKQLDHVTYDSDGNETERTIYDDYGFLVGKEVRIRDAKGNLVETVLTDPDGAIIEKKTYAYDGGDRTQVSTYDKDKISLRQVNTYDTVHRLREETYYDLTIARGKTIYKYDDKKHVAEVAFYLTSGAKAVAPIGPCLGAHRVVYSYDSQDRTIRVIAYEADGKVKASWQYDYASGQEVIGYVKATDWSQTRFSYQNEYDSHGNWIKRIVTVETKSKFGEDVNGSRKTAVTREIEYYP